MYKSFTNVLKEGLSHVDVDGKKDNVPSRNADAMAVDPDEPSTMEVDEKMNDPRKLEDIVETVKRSISEVLLIPYYFMAGRLNFNFQTRRLELVCNNAGVLFVGASSKLTIKDLGDVSSPNPSFQHLISRTFGFRSLAETPIWTIQARFMFGWTLTYAEIKKS
ncbi:Rosmarinate synthase [Acorus calamus]|uniref:Rosmarinate synthase n=1 Tax=Acorus calamus TaxID=4465 RepID=A0AAV9CTZ3_ACOCL|nr:Rosmarinate synthase [Acorus calamus]